MSAAWPVAWLYDLNGVLGAPSESCVAVESWHSRESGLRRITNEFNSDPNFLERSQAVIV